MGKEMMEVVGTQRKGCEGSAGWDFRMRRLF